MFRPLLQRLRYGADLTEADYGRLSELARTRQVGARQQIIQQGDRPEDVHLVLDGFACRYKVLPNGSRQIIALLVPGDFSDLHVAILGKMDHSIATLSPCTVADIPRATILDLIGNHPRIARALRWATLADVAILREWLVNMGQREAHHQLAHLFCELLIRLQAAGVGDTNGYSLPLTQEDMADVLGLTSVHVNRTLQLLREEGLIVLRRRRLDIPDVERLMLYCDFNPDYLHLVKRVE